MPMGINYARAVSTDLSVHRTLPAGVWGSDVKVQYDEITLVAEAAGAVIEVGMLPRGAVFLEAVIVHAALGTGVTLALGDPANTSRYMAAAAAATAGTLEARASTGVGFIMPANTIIQILIGGGAATGRVQIVIEYSLS